MEPAANSSTRTNQHCWECRRRRLICDGGVPVCTKCRTAGIVCPGYADKKPLTWLAPGRVVSRNRKPKAAATSTSLPSTTGRKKKTKDEPPAQDTSKSLYKLDLRVVPKVLDLRPKAWDIIEAAAYYNSYIYPDLKAHALGSSLFIQPVQTVTQIPLSVVHTLVSVALSHRIIQVSEGDTSLELVQPMSTSLYRHRGMAMRSIQELLGNEKTRRDIPTLVSVYLFMIAVLQQSFTPHWRVHVNGFISLLNLNGSFLTMVNESWLLRPSLMGLLITGIFANTTTRPDRQLHLTDTTAETLNLIQEHYTESFYPPVACPPALLNEIILINQLRSCDGEPSESRSSSTDPAPQLQLQLRAAETLSRIESFDPDGWAASHETLQETWLLIAKLHRAATALFCILSLQSCGILQREPSGAPELELARAKHARELFSLLEEGFSTPMVKRRMTWALVVAGVEAARAGKGVQKYIGGCLHEICRSQGLAATMVVKRVLERFWSKGGEGGWDGCWEGDEGYAFIL
ncbi:putative C6 zinc finger domain protein [Cladorrhinum samala]|uniref:C6 zinc finger domain protein n=1 Tax=Cladorrhinum samala TaxID=585594 RepID=A0AAV9HZ80_9PEZI|nr:putative C6 zinc finger domain protein [Cladorrhinum samala]